MAPLFARHLPVLIRMDDSDGLTRMTRITRQVLNAFLIMLIVGAICQRSTHPPYTHAHIDPVDVRIPNGIRLNPEANPVCHGQA
jgi:hypothetical protein